MTPEYPGTKQVSGDNETDRSPHDAGRAEVTMNRRIVITIFVAQVAILAIIGIVLIGVASVSPEETTNRNDPVVEPTPGQVG